MNKVIAVCLMSSIPGVSATWDPSLEMPHHAVSDQSIAYQYLRYVNKYGKDYKTLDEYNHRMVNFKRTHTMLQKLNSLVTTQTVGHNKFSDWNELET